MNVRPFLTRAPRPVGRPSVPGQPVPTNGDAGTRGRVKPDGSHLELDGGPFQVKGVTYGSFVRRPDGARFPDQRQIADDLAAMAALGLNTVRTYDLPPPDLLDLAGELGLRILVGVTYHDWLAEARPGRPARRRILDAGRREVDRAMTRCAGRAEVLAVAVGNELPADVVRLHGIGAVEDTLAALVAAVHEADPEMPATYCSFPTTEFLHVPGIDLTCFNVFLEDEEQFRRYVGHLQVVSQERPMLLTELGLSSGLHGPARQADVLGWQLRTVDELGCAGATVFSWTDDWAVGDQAVTGWGFGLTDEARRPKPAIDVVRTWARRGVADTRPEWPLVSVVVCAYNEERTLAECLGSLVACEYPNLEVIVCDDGSTDRTLEIARSFPFRVQALPHGGLSLARNQGIAAATGAVIAFIDADATCHRHWPFHLVAAFDDAAVAAAGGPNLPVPGVGRVERAVAAAPGNATHVLVTDDRAEHVPGCNMAFRADDLRSIGGFNPVFTSAGDDVDVCWKILDNGREIAFAAAAQVRHHRRPTVRGYLRQQRGYGRAEGLLAGAHPHRVNRLGQARWRGNIYEGLGIIPKILRPVVYHGPMGTAPFQPVTIRRPELVAGRVGALLPLLLAVNALGLGLGLFFPWALTLSAAATAVVVGYAIEMARQAPLPAGEPRPGIYRLLVGFLHLAQPLARSWGRLRTRRPPAPVTPAPAWTGERTSWLHALDRALRARGCVTRSAGDHDRWDIETAVGPLLACRITTAVLWQWEPRWRLRFRCRRTTVVTALAGLAGALWTPLVPAVVGTALCLGVIHERITLRTRVLAALRATTASAFAAPPGGERT